MQIKPCRKEIKIFKPLDAVIAAAVVLAAAVCVFTMAAGASSADLKAVVRQNGTVIKTISLSQLDKPLEFTVGDEVKVTVSAQRDGVSVINSQCRDKLCVACGKLQTAGQTAVCLPAKITVELIADGQSKQNIDAVTG